jgi:hypothetical protein
MGEGGTLDCHVRGTEDARQRIGGIGDRSGRNCPLPALLAQRQTLGLLERRHVKIDQIKCIGKESNSLEDVDAGLVHSEKNTYTEYVDPKRDE